MSIHPKFEQFESDFPEALEKGDTIPCPGIADITQGIFSRYVATVLDSGEDFDGNLFDQHD